MKWRNVKLEDIQTRLTPILQNVQYAAARAVPLGRPTYDRIVQRQQIGLFLQVTPGRINDVFVDQHHVIHFPLRGLEHLWALFFAHVVICDQIKAAKGILDFNASVSAQQACQRPGKTSQSWPGQNQPL